MITILLIIAMCICAVLSMFFAVIAMFGGGGPELGGIAGIFFVAAWMICGFLSGAFP